MGDAGPVEKASGGGVEVVEAEGDGLASQDGGPAQGPAAELYTVVEAEGGGQTREVPFDSRDVDTQTERNLFIRLAGCDEFKNLSFSGGEDDKADFPGFEFLHKGLPLVPVKAPSFWTAAKSLFSYSTLFRLFL